jgi:hypothetical protein
MKSLKRLFCLATVASGALLCAQMPAGLHRPAAVPDGYVVTPFGYYHPSCVVHLAKGDTVVNDGPAIQHADGTFDNIPACNYPRYTARGEVVTAGAAELPTISWSWIETIYATTNTSYGGVIETWNVPPNPTSHDGQTVYFFPGLEGGLTILQPVLGWNADFGNAWGIASWQAGAQGSGIAIESTPRRVSVGDLIVGEVMSNCSSGTLSCPTWFVMTEDAGKGSTTLPSTTSYGQTFYWAAAGTLEVYNLVQCSDYPSNGSLAFNGALYDNNFEPINVPGWSLEVWPNLTPQCNYGGQVAGVTLDY